MIFYISCRPLYLGTILLTPKEQLKNGFKGLNFKHDLLAADHNKDGRFLYEIKISDEYNSEKQEEIKSVILEGLQVFGVHLKSSESAKELAESITNKEYTIESGKLERNV